MRIALTFALGLSVLLSQPLRADDWPRFRGANGEGKCVEKGLLTKWPEGGPEKLWTVDGLGDGYSSPAIVGDKVYVTGSEGGRGMLRCISTKGEELWKVEYAPEWTGDFPGARSTPTVHDGKVYVFSGTGVAVCHDAETGKQLWKVDTVERFGARNIQWGFSESLLTDGNDVIVTPGGPKVAVAKLSGKTGKTLWAMTGSGEKSAYCSPAFVRRSKRGKGGVIVTMLEHNIVGIDPRRGRLLWKVGHKNTYSVHSNTPLLSRSGYLICSSGYGTGTTAIRVSGNGAAGSKAWAEKIMDNHFGGNLMFGDVVFGTSSNRPKARLLALDARNGNKLGESRSVGKAQLITAGKFIYAYNQEPGAVVLLTADTQMREVSRFSVDHGSGQHWAHLAISGGVLYVRHGNAMAAYKIK